jgi:hypothetical protein
VEILNRPVNIYVTELGYRLARNGAQGTLPSRSRSPRRALARKNTPRPKKMKTSHR